MKSNVGGLDRTLRIVLGAAGVALAIYWKTWWGLVPLAVLLTGLVRFCGLYVPFGLSTCKLPNNQPPKP
jgi:hypothetical protein